jgi:hypothetical protein
MPGLSQREREIVFDGVKMNAHFAGTDSTGSYPGVIRAGVDK